ncbi:MAG TPA: hypothetical protein PKD00_05475, partial [Burkholderiales bacterium]|nr:hypothetical protein [Burkholderiales bacterium]
MYEFGDLFTGGSFENDMTNWAKERRNAFFGDVYEPVYGEGISNKLTDPSWWIVNGGGLVESVGEFAASSAIVGGLLGKGAAMAARLTNASARAARGGQAVSQGLTSVSAAYMEGAMSGAEVYKNVLDKKISEGMLLDDAKRYAGNAAATTVGLNTVINSVLNFTSVAPLFRSADDIAKARRYAVERGLAPQAGETIDDMAARIAATTFSEAEKKTVKNLFGIPLSKNTRKLAGEAAQESLEEIVNVFAEQEGLQAGGMLEDTSWMKTFFNVLGSEEGQLSAMLGALGGIGNTALLSRIPIHNYTETVTDTDTAGKTIQRPDGKTRWVSSRFLEDKEAQKTFDDYQTSVAKDLERLSKSQQRLAHLTDQLRNADDTETEAIKNQIEVEKQNLFNFSLYASLQQGNVDTLKAMFTELGGLDNTKDLGEELALKLQTVEAKINDPNTAPEMIPTLEQEKVMLQTEYEKVAGKTEAMVKGLAKDKTDNAYKDIAKKRVELITKLEPVYDELMNRYNYGDELTYGLAKYAFNMRAEVTALEDMVVELKKRELELQNIAPVVLDTTANLTSIASIENYVKNQTLIFESIKALQKKQKAHTELLAGLDTMNDLEIQRKLAELGVPLPAIPVLDKAAVRKAADDYWDNYQDSINASLTSADSDLNKFVLEYAQQKGYEKLDTTTGVTVVDMEKSKKELEKEYKRNYSTYRSKVQFERNIKDIDNTIKFLRTTYDNITSAKGRKEFIEYAKKEFETIKNRGAEASVNAEAQELKKTRLINELVLKGFDRPFAEALVAALVNNTPMPTQYRGMKVYVQGTKNWNRQERYVVIVEANGHVKLIQAADEFVSKKAIRKIIDIGAAFKQYKGTEQEVKYKGKVQKQYRKTRQITFDSFVNDFRVLSTAENASAASFSKLKRKRTAAMAAMEAVEGQLETAQLNQENAVNLLTEKLNEVNTYNQQFLDWGHSAAAAIIDLAKDELSDSITDTLPTLTAAREISSLLREYDKRVKQYNDALVALFATKGANPDFKSELDVLTTAFAEDLSSIKGDVSSLINSTLNAVALAKARKDVSATPSPSLSPEAETALVREERNRNINRYKSKFSTLPNLTTLWNKIMNDTDDTQFKNMIVTLEELRLKEKETQEKLLQHQRSKMLLQKSIDTANEYISELRTLPLEAFKSDPMQMLVSSTEGMLRQQFGTEFNAVQANVKITQDWYEATVYKKIIEAHKDAMSKGEESPYSDELVAVLQEKLDKFEEGLMKTTTTDIRPIGNIDNFLAKFEALSKDNFTLKTLDKFIDAEMIILRYDYYETLLAHTVEELADLRDTLKEIRRVRSDIRKALLLSLKDASGKSEIKDATIAEVMNRLSELGINISDPTNLVQAIFFLDKNSTSYNNLYNELYKKFESDALTAKGALILSATEAAEIKKSVEDELDYLKNLVGSTADPTTQHLLDELDKLQTFEQALFNTSKDLMFVHLLEKHLSKGKILKSFEYHYNRRLSRFDKPFYDYEFNADMDPAETKRKNSYTVGKKTRTAFSTTNIAEIKAGVAKLTSDGSVVIDQIILGVHNEETGNQLNPDNATDRIEIEKYLATNRWFNFTGSQQAKKLIDDENLNLELKPLNDLINELDEALIDTGNTPDEKKRYEVLKKELIQLKDKIKSENPSTRGDELVESTIIGLAVKKEAGKVQYILASAGFEAQINEQKEGIVWTVLRDVDTMFPLDPTTERVTTNVDDLRIAMSSVEEEMKKIKVEQVKANTYRFYYTESKGGQSYLMYPGKDKEGNDITDIEISPVDKDVEIWNIKKAIALDMMREQYDEFIEEIRKQDAEVYVKVNNVSPGINMLVSNIDATTGIKTMRTVTLDRKNTSGDTGELKVVTKEGITIGGVQYMQFEAGQLVYIDKHSMPRLATTTTIGKLDSDLQVQIQDVFLYSLLLAATTKASLGSLTVKTTSEGPFWRRNDNMPSSDINVFPSNRSEESNKGQSILEHFLNWGKKFNKQTKEQVKNVDQIYIESGKVVMISRQPDNTYKTEEVLLADILSGSPGSYYIDKSNPEVKKILAYLGNKRMNVNKKMLDLKKANLFYLPKLSSKLKTGTQISLGTFPEQKSAFEMQKQPAIYEDWLIDKGIVQLVVTPQSITNSNISRFVGQRNLVFGKSISKTFVDKQTTKSSTETTTSTGGSLSSISKLKGDKSKPKNETKTSVLNPSSEGGLSSISKLKSKTKRQYFESASSEAVVRANLSKIFGEQFVSEQFEFLQDMIAENVVGQFSADGKIIISAYAAPSTEYHEAFHRVWRLFVPENEMKEIIAEFKTRKDWKDILDAKREEGYNDLTEAELIEEVLGDDFKYYMQKRVVQGKKIRTWFDKLIAFFKALLGDKTQTLFEDIANGKYANLVPSKTTTGNAFKRTTNTGLTDIQATNVSDVVNLRILQSLRDRHLLFDLTASKVDVWQEVLAMLGEVSKEYKIDKLTTYIKDLTTLVNETESLKRNRKLSAGDFEKLKDNITRLKDELFISRFVNTIRGLNVVLDDDKIIQELNDVSQSIDGTYEVTKDISNYKVSFELDGREKMSTTAKLLVATLSDNRKMSKNTLGGTENKVVTLMDRDWNLTVSTLINFMSNTPAAFMPARLRKLATLHPKYAPLVEYLDDQSKSKQTLITQLLSSLNNHNYTMSIQMLKKEGDKMSFYPADANVNASADMAIQKWVSEIERSGKTPKEFFVAARGNMRIREYLNSFFLNLPPFVFEENETTKKMRLYDYQAYAPNGGATELDVLVDEFIGLVQTALRSAPNMTYSDIFGKDNDYKGTLNKIGDILAQISMTRALSIMNGQGKMYYTVNDPSYITTVIDDINFFHGADNNDFAEFEKVVEMDVEGDPTQYIEQVRSIVLRDIQRHVNNARNSNVYANTSTQMINRLVMLYYFNPQIFAARSNANSIWKSNILDFYLTEKSASGSPLQLIIKDSMKNSTENEASHLSQLNKVDFLATVVSSAAYNEFKSLQHADRSVYYFYKTPPRFELHSDSVITSSLAVTLFDYLKDEMQQLVDMGATEYKGMLSDYVKTTDNRLKLLLDNALKSNNIEGDLNSLKVQLLSVMENNIIEKSSEFFQLLKDRQLLNKKTDTYRLLFNDNNFNLLTKLKDNYSEGKLRNLSTIVWANLLISNIEQVKFFTGNVVNFKTAGNFWKRMVTQSSTGSTMHVTPDTVSEVNERNAETLRKYGIRYGKTENGLATEIVFTEQEEVSRLRKAVKQDMFNYYKNLYTNHPESLGLKTADNAKIDKRATAEAEKFASSYDKMNENDGMGWINPFAYRAYKIFQGEWSDELQNVFDFEMIIYADARNSIDNGLPDYTP